MSNNQPNYHKPFEYKEPEEKEDLSKNLLSPEFMESLESNARLKGNLSRAIEENNFLKFKETFEIYYKNSYTQKNFEFTPSLNSLKLLFDYIESSNKDTAIVFFAQANLVTPEAILMSLFTQKCNTKLSKLFKQIPCNKHEDYWSKGIEISTKYFETFCEHFNKDEFLEEKDSFMEIQNKFIMNYKLNFELKEKPPASLLKIKI